MAVNVVVVHWSDYPDAHENLALLWEIRMIQKAAAFGWFEESTIKYHSYYPTAHASSDV